MDNFNLKKYLAENYLLKENVNNKYVVKNIDPDDGYEYYSIDTYKATKYLSQFNSENFFSDDYDEVNAAQFVNDDEGWGTFEENLYDVENMSDRELEDAMREAMSLYYYSDSNSIQ